MKRSVLLLAVALVIALAMPAWGGNGLDVTGTHYNLNIIGVNTKTADMTNKGGNVIFVPLNGDCNIMLSPGDTYQVLDANGTDGVAKFQLPNPDVNNTGYTAYSVYARALGKLVIDDPKSSNTTTCAYDGTTKVCSIYQMVLVRGQKTKFTNYSKELLYIYADIGDGLERFPLFDAALQDYFWDYDNNGLKLAQLRFYPVSTNVN